jgi:hypothetical protein
MHPQLLVAALASPPNSPPTIVAPNFERAEVSVDEDSTLEILAFEAAGEFANGYCD